MSGTPAPFHHKSDEQKCTATLFVRNLSFDTTSAQLESFFSDIAPVKNAFVVTNPAEPSKCRGFGFVQFALKEDAQRAINETSAKLLNKRKLLLDFANKRNRSEEENKERRSKKKDNEPSKIETLGDTFPEKKRAESDAVKPTRITFDEDDDDDEEKDEDAANAATENMKKFDSSDEESNDDDEDDEDDDDKDEENYSKAADSASAGLSKKTMPLKSEENAKSENVDTKVKPPKVVSTDVLTVVIKGLSSNTTRKHLFKKCNKLKKVVSITMREGKEEDNVNNGTARNGVAEVTFATPAEAKYVASKLDGHIFKGTTITALIKSKEKYLQAETSKALKRSRLIIRNLAFQCTKKDLETAFRPFGEIIDIKLPVHETTGKCKGFAFVQYTNVFDAGKAITALNAKPILSRQIAVDWALAKDKYEELKQSSESKAAQEAQSAAVKMDISKKKSEESEDESGESESDIDGINSAVNDGEDDEEDDDDEDDDDDENENEKEDDDDDEDEGEKERSSKPRIPKTPDVERGLTIFIRNLSFDTEEEDLEECFEQFGEVQYAKIVTDQESGMSKGTAFVKFKTKEAVDKCVVAASSRAQELRSNPKLAMIQEGGIMLDGRSLSVTVAVDREKAKVLKDENEKDRAKKTEDTDKRNLYLAREGYIDPDSEIGASLPKTDMTKRIKAEQEKRAKLKNPNFFVSKTRLSIRNLPLTVDDKQLRKIFQDAAIAAKVAASESSPDNSATAGSEAVAEGKEPVKKRSRRVTVKQAKVVRSKDRVDADGVARSTGFGFVEFDAHEDALSALRKLNNNPDVFGPNRRLIVEFAVENRLALQKREQSLQRQKERTSKIEAVAKSEKKNGKSDTKKGLKEGSLQDGKKSVVGTSNKVTQPKANGKPLQEKAHLKGAKQADAALPNLPKSAVMQQKRGATESASTAESNKRTKMEALNSSTAKNRKSAKKNVEDDEEPGIISAANGRSRKISAPLETEKTVKQKKGAPNKLNKQETKEEDKLESLIAKYRSSMAGDSNASATLSTPSKSASKVSMKRWFQD